MNTKQEIIALQIINELKNNEGYATINDLSRYFDGNPMYRHTILKNLKEIDLVDWINERKDSYRLTEKGWEFENFEKYREEKKQEKDIQTLTLKNLKGNVFHIKWWWLILLINAAISLGIGYLLKD